MYPDALSHCATEAIDRLHANLFRLMTPAAAMPMWQWLAGLAGTESPVNYFGHPLAFPVLLLPWWLEETIQSPDPAWQTDLAYSTINGYYYIRLIDNVMDNPAAVEAQLLPAVAFFYTEFQRVYQPYFPTDHPFWGTFTEVWLHAAAITLEDARLAAPTETQFEQIAAQKISAVKIPLAATAHRHGQIHRLEPWNRLVDRLGCWHQQLNDLLGWHTDFTRQTATWFLAEADRQRNDTESVIGWVARQGLDWAVNRLDSWMIELRQIAAELNSPGLQQYLDTRQAMLNKQVTAMQIGLRELVKIEAAIAKKRQQ